MNLNQFKNLKLPEKPGVYFFLKGKDILYIGKATSLKDRTKSYFAKDVINTRGPLIVDMVFKADTIKWQETDSVLEALILESSLIKKHQPIYNTKEKDDKSFNYVCITKELKIAILRGKDLNFKKFKKVFGPFPSGGTLREAMKIIRKIFPYIEDRKGTKGKEEFYKQIKLLPKDSVNNKRNIKNIELFFEGKKGKIVKSLEIEMKKLAKKEEFEKANEIKRQLFALKHINDVSLIKGDNLASQSFSSDLLEKTPARFTQPDISQNHFFTSFRIEAYDIAHMSGKNMVGVMVVLEDGEPAKNEYRKFKIKNYLNSNDTGALKEVLERRFKHNEWRMPDLIVVDGSTAQKNITEKILKERNLDIPVAAVVKDDRHKARAILLPQKFSPVKVLGSSYSARPDISQKKISEELQKQIILANSEAHRFAITFHKKLRSENFLK